MNGFFKLDVPLGRVSLRISYMGYKDETLNNLLVIAGTYQNLPPRPFVPGKVSDPSFDGTQDGGFGWFMIQSCFDDVTYFRDEMGSNRLRLKINLNTPEK